jgi:hypothetical protein
MYKKLFFPLGGGEELESRVYGALLIAKYFNTHLEILKSTPGLKDSIPGGIPDSVMEDLEDIIVKNSKEDNKSFEKLIDKIAGEFDITLSDKPIESQTTVYVDYKYGDRSTMVAQESKFCDLVIAAAPPNGYTTATFEASVLSSGKPVLMFPRELKTFKADSIIIGWNNSQEASRALSYSIGLLQQAKKVHIVTSQQYTNDLQSLDKLKEYLSFYDIEVTIEMIETTLFPGEALLNSAIDGEFDLIVAGAYGHKGLKELMLGGATKYLFTHAHIPILMSH